MKVSEAQRPQPSPVPSPPPWRLELAMYQALTRLARPAAGVILELRARQGKEDPLRRKERFGTASLQRPAGALIWVHAASVGEANAVLPLIQGLRQRRPDATVLMTTGTVTSASFVASRQPVGVIHQYVPLDSPAFVARFLEHWRPDLGVLTEQEIWPNLVVEASSRGIPLALVNARMSDRSFARWQRRGGLARALFSRFNLVTAQNASLAERFRELGAPLVFDAGNLKIDAPPLPVSETFRSDLKQFLGNRPRLVAASTHAGEEVVLAKVHKQLAARISGFCSLIAPRHPERGNEIAAVIKASGLTVAQRSQGQPIRADTDIYIADTIGELGTLYAIAPVAFIGGSLIPHGGQNPIEAVRHGAAVITGPHWHNFPDAYKALLAAGGAIEVRTAEELATAVAELLTDDAALARSREHGEHALVELSGALERTLACLLPMIPETPRRSISAG